MTLTDKVFTTVVSLAILPSDASDFKMLLEDARSLTCTCSVNRSSHELTS